MFSIYGRVELNGLMFLKDDPLKKNLIAICKDKWIITVIVEFN